LGESYLNACFRWLAGAAILLATTQGTPGQSSGLLPATIGSEKEGDNLETVSRKNGDTLIPTCRFEGARCGYIDRNGNTVIAPQFDSVRPFVADRAVVGRAGKYGVIDATGRVVIAPAYDSMSNFDRGLALVLIKDRLGVIDRDGQLVVPAEHGLIIRIADNAFLVTEPPFARPGRQLDWLDARLFVYAYGKRWGVVAAGGSWKLRPIFTEVQVFSDDLNGLFWAAKRVDGRTRWQLVGPDGTAVNDELFDHVQGLQPGQGRAIVQRDRRWGAINGKGEIVIDLKFDWLGYFRDGWAPYRLAGREGRMDRDGNVLSDAVVQPRKPDSKVGAVVGNEPLIVTVDNRPAPDISFEYVQLACHGPSVVKRDGKWGFIAADGKLLADRYFDLANAFHDGIATIVDNGLWAVLGEGGSILLGPLKLARGTATSGNGEYSIEFEEGFKRLDKALIAELARNPDALTRRLAPRLPWSEGLAAQFDDKSGKWGFIGPTKNFVIAPQFDAVASFAHGAAWAAFPDRREWCLIDKVGQIKPGTQCQCDQPLVIVEHYIRPSHIGCYDDGVRIVRGYPAIRGMAN
jgi:hypothetical protein